jgi:predicted Zn-dependent protease
LAAELFDAALFAEVNHPLATVGLTNILLNTSTLSTNDNESTLASSISEDDALIARNRALGLLQQLTSSAQGWDVPGAWFALARAYELGGEMERAKAALWKCVSLEDRRGIRGWKCVRPRIV